MLLRAPLGIALAPAVVLPGDASTGALGRVLRALEGGSSAHHVRVCPFAGHVVVAGVA